MGNSTSAGFCVNCGAPREGGAAFCARCGRNFTEEFKGTPLADVGEVTETFVRLRESLGDRYVIERELGKGGMATVHLAHDVKHDRDVAIKVLHPELAASIGAERFEREIRLAARLQHPHILGLYDSGSVDGLLYYVMPFVRGESLRDRLDREGMLPVDAALRITAEVASALQHAHEQGVVHRDIKPENVLLSGDHALVADFGIARAANDAGGSKLTKTGVTVGTPVYMAPEQSSGDPVGPAADIYSLGCMLYEMLAGEPPFTGTNAMAIMSKHLMEQVPSVRVVRSAVPEEVEEAIFHAMAKTVADRPKSAQAFAEMLGMVTGGPGMRRTPRPSSSMRGSVAIRARGTTHVPRQTVAGAVFKVDEFGELVEVEPLPWWKRPVTLAASAAVLVLGAVGAWMVANQPTSAASVDPTLSRVAVLYFDTADPALRSAADGITEGLIRSLSRVSAITTISQAGSDSVRNIASTDSIAKLLRVGFFVRGSLRAEGDRVAINYRLQTRSGSPAGDGSVTVARDSLLLVQDSIARLAAALIRPALGVEIEIREQRLGTASNAAWLLVQDGNGFQRRADAAVAARDLPGAFAFLLQADSAYARAESLDARWGEPAVRRANLAFQRAQLGPRTSLAVRPWVTTGFTHVERALAIDPEDADALEARGNLRFFGFISGMYGDAESQAELRLAQQDLELATRLNPRQAGAWTTLASAYNLIPGKGRDQIMLAAQRALEADEFQKRALIVRARLAVTTYDAGDFDAADRFCSDLESLNRRHARAIRCRLYLQSVPGRASYDIARSWRLVDSLVVAEGVPDTTLARLTGNIFAAATIARVAVAERSSVLADSARRVTLRSEADATIDKPRELIYFASMVSVILGDTAEWERRLAAYVAVSPASRSASLVKDPGWWFQSVSQTPEWRRLMGVGGS